MEFWPYLFLSWPSKHWNSDLLFYTLEFWSHPSKHRKCGPIIINIGIFILSLYCNLWNSGCILPTIVILALILYTLEFWCHPSNYFSSGPIWPYTHWHSNPFLLNVGIRTLFLYTLEFCPQPSKDWNSSLIFVNIGILNSYLILPPPAPPPLQTLEFWPSFYKQWKSHLIHPHTGVLALF